MEERPKVGVGVIILRNGKVLLGKRKGAHGEGTWSFPGGHLEKGEEIEECAMREVYEETGLQISNLRRGPYTNDVFEQIGKHYVTLYIIGEYSAGIVQLKEPEKCEEWKWFDWSELPTPLFLPIVHLVKSGYSPFS